MHETRPIKVWVDVDIGIAAVVNRLQQIEGVRTDASCEGGDSYGPYVMCHWTAEGLAELKKEFIVRPEGNGTWGHVHPRLPCPSPHCSIDGQACDECGGSGYVPALKAGKDEQ